MKKLLLLTLLLFPATGFADSLAIASSTIDWRNFSFSFTGNYVLQPNPSLRTYTNGDGYSVAGFMESISDIQVDGVREYTSAGMNYGFGLNGSGAGSVTVSMPYLLTTNCSAAARGEATTAFASARLNLNGGGTGGTQKVELECREGSEREGVLSVTSTFFFTQGPVWHLTFDIDANTVADSYAQVPEPSSLMLLSCGVVGLAMVRRSLLRSYLR